LDWISGMTPVWSVRSAISNQYSSALAKAWSTRAVPHGVSGFSTWTVPNR